MLARFRKPGGFVQLLQLVESSEPAKQKTMLQLVCQEDPGWGHLLSSKLLTPEKIMKWPAPVLMEIGGELTPQMAAGLLVELPKPLGEKLMASLPSTVGRAVRETMEVGLPPGQAFASRVKLVQIVRSLVERGKLDFATFDPSLAIDLDLVS